MRKKFIIVLTALSLFAIGCRSKGDWRERYQQQKRQTLSKNNTYNTSKNNRVSKSDDLDQSLFSNYSLYDAVKLWYGTPYRYGGTSKTGVDCSGFVQQVYRTVYNKELPRVSADMAEVIDRKYTKNLKEGDLVFFSFVKSGRVSHVGIYLRDNYFVHASTKKGVIVSSLEQPTYNKHLVRCGTPK